MKKVLFLHVPKTSGSSLKAYFKERIDGFYIQANSRHQLEKEDRLLGRVSGLEGIRKVLDAHAGLALHVDSNFGPAHQSSDFRSLCPLVFDPAHASYFKGLTILTMLRDPFKRFQSEAAFIARKQQADSRFLPDLVVADAEQHLARTLDDPMLHFLLESDFHARRSFTAADLERVKRCILDYPIHVGIYERYAESVAYFGRVLGRDDFAAAELPQLNVGARAPEAPPGLEDAFRKRNGLDQQLYDFALGLFEERTRHLRA